jgi:rubrerythrin
MRKDELLAKLETSIRSEDGAIEKYTKYYVQLLEQSELPEERKALCRPIIQRLHDDSVRHRNTLEQLKLRITSRDRDEF